MSERGKIRNAGVYDRERAQPVTMIARPHVRGSHSLRARVCVCPGGEVRSSTAVRSIFEYRLNILPCSGPRHFCSTLSPSPHRFIGLTNQFGHNAVNTTRGHMRGVRVYPALSKVKWMKKKGDAEGF